MNKFSFRIKITNVALIILTAVFWILFANFSFFAALLNDYPLNFKNIGFLVTIAIGFTGVSIIILSIFCHRYTIKPLLILLLISSSFSAYFMDSYNIAIDDLMIKNIVETNINEASDLISSKMFIYLLFLGILPSILVYRANIKFSSFKKELFTHIKVILITLIVVLGLLFVYSAKTSSFFREHKIIRRYSNPGNYVVGLGRYIRNQLRSNTNKPIIQIGKDAKISISDANRKLVIMVVGETARADRFSLNGYIKETNPLLKQQNIVSFTNVESCGTLTAISVPCMFAIDGEDSFDVGEAKNKENALDILKRVGVNILWRDNNSSSKHVADRVIHQDYRTSKSNSICDIECRDEGMLVGLQEYINAHKKGNILIILHSMGNHGPAYYKRYPKEFEKFTPICKTNELSDCSKNELNNTYDNAILYTDYFLNKTIKFLKQNDNSFETFMLYVSDHGESLGENGLYLHGMPNFIAPRVQRHVPMIIWIGKKFNKISIEQLKAKKNNPFSHDNIFHTLLGLMEVDSKIYKKDMDLIRK